MGKCSAIEVSKLMADNAIILTGRRPVTHVYASPKIVRRSAVKKAGAELVARAIAPGYGKIGTPASKRLHAETVNDIPVKGTVGYESERAAREEPVPGTPTVRMDDDGILPEAFLNTVSDVIADVLAQISCGAAPLPAAPLPAAPPCFENFDSFLESVPRKIALAYARCSEAYSYPLPSSWSPCAPSAPPPSSRALYAPSALPPSSRAPCAPSVPPSSRAPCAPSASPPSSQDPSLLLFPMLSKWDSLADWTPFVRGPPAPPSDFSALTMLAKVASSSVAPNAASAKRLRSSLA